MPKVNIFVGRTAELGTLAEVATRAASGVAAAIVIGPPGSGKSRLLAEAQNPHAISAVRCDRRLLHPVAEMAVSNIPLPGGGGR